MSSPEKLSTSSEATTPPPQPLLLEAAPEGSDIQKLDVQSEKPLKFDNLGPMVVNSDGTLSRIANWAEMSEIEHARIVRVLLKRNQIRLADQESKIASDA